MRILYTNFHSGDGGGHTTYIRELARALVSNHEIHVASPFGSRLFAEMSAMSGVNAVAQSFPGGLRLGEQRRAAALLREYIQKNSIDIVHVNGSVDHRLAIGAVRGLANPPRIVMTKHNTKSLHGLQHAWRARFYTDKIIAVCDHVRAQVEETPYRHCDVETIHNGIDVCHFHPWESTRSQAARNNFCPDDDVLIVGSNAGTAAYKGWLSLVDAVSRLEEEERRRLRILVMGKLPSREQHAGVCGRDMQECFLFPGLLEDVRPGIAAIDAGFVLSHDVETISFACREMMAMGKPVMVSNYAGLPENVSHGRDGWIVPVGGYATMAETLHWMLRNRSALPSMGEAARKKAVAEFSAVRFVRKTEEIYRTLLNETFG